MPFRFRKIFRLGKGFRLNLSKGGISTSIGKAGSTLNIGKRGIRPTVGIPGSGLSFTPSMGSGASAKNGNVITSSIAFIISLILICVICVCIVGLIFFPTTDGTTTNTPTAVTIIDPAIIIANTSSAAQTQTRIAEPFTSTPFTYSTATYMPPVTLAPTWTPFPTNTPIVFSTQAIIIPAGGNSGGVCACAGDTLNCKDFSNHAEAQACFSYCMSQGVGDIHKLDENNDGNACESLP